MNKKLYLHAGVDLVELRGTVYPFKIFYSLYATVTFNSKILIHYLAIFMLLIIVMHYVYIASYVHIGFSSILVLHNGIPLCICSLNP